MCVLSAQWVGDAATHSLYHGQLEVKCVPWLPEEPAAGLDLDLLPVSAVMRTPVVTLQVCPPSQQATTVSGCAHARGGCC